MATNHTEHYGLSLWEPGDAFVRTEFNGDNAKVDEALHGLETGKADAGSVNSRFSSVNSALSGLTARVEVRTGRYTGDGAATRTVQLGFTPKAVLVESAHGLRSAMGYGGLAVTGSPCKNGDNVAVEVVSGGFRVGYDANKVNTNASGAAYHYIALK